MAVAPTAFGIPAAITITDALNKKWVELTSRGGRPLKSTMSGGALADSCRYANKLVPEKGLALSVYDVMTAEDGKVTWGNGMMYYKGKSSIQLFLILS